MNWQQLQMLYAQLLRNRQSGDMADQGRMNALSGWGPTPNIPQPGPGENYTQYSNAVQGRAANGGIGGSVWTQMPSQRPWSMPGLGGMYSSPTNWTPGVQNGVIRPYANTAAAGGHDPWGRW